jgi:hypothetical protein
MRYTKLETYKVLVIQHEHVILTENCPPFVTRKVNERINIRMTKYVRLCNSLSLRKMKVSWLQLQLLVTILALA